MFLLQQSIPPVASVPAGCHKTACPCPTKLHCDAGARQVLHLQPDMKQVGARLTSLQAQSYRPSVVSNATTSCRPCWVA